MKTMLKNAKQEKIENREVIFFEKGMYGFENVKKFVILNHSEEEHNPFHWLCATNDEVCFVVLEPRFVVDDYEFDIDDNTVELLEANENTQFVVLCIVVIPKDIKEMTINLKSPIIINTENNKAVQIILDDEKYTIRHKLIKNFTEGK